MNATLKKNLDFLIEILVIIGIAVFVFVFIAHKTHVVGASMEPGFNNGDQVMVEKVTYYLSEPKRFDVIVFPYKQNPHNHYIKRIIGLPGEVVDFKDGKIYINDAPLLESYGKEIIDVLGDISLPFTVPNGEYFVMGDNRNHSSDSRFSDVGTIKKEDIDGKAWIRLWPFSDFGFVN